MGLRPETGRPEEYIWQYISVPPVCIRPSVAQDGASNEDDLTAKLSEIVYTSALIRQGLASGVPTTLFMVYSLTRSLIIYLTVDNTGTMGFPTSQCCNLYQLRCSRSPSPPISKTDPWILSTPQGQARTVPWQPLWETCRFLRSYRHLTRPELTHRRGRST